MRVQKKASLHEKTVQKVAKGEVRPAKRARKKVQPKTTTVKVTKPNPMVLAVAKEIAPEGTHIIVRNENTILIVNNLSYLKRVK